jgi:hypothetical protein
MTNPDRQLPNSEMYPKNGRETAENVTTRQIYVLTLNYERSTYSSEALLGTSADVTTWGGANGLAALCPVDWALGFFARSGGR